MEKFLIKGPSKIRGKVDISGSKNAALPILAATLLFDKPVVIANLPRVKDIDTMLNLLRSLGSKVELSKNKKIVKISKTNKKKLFASYSLVKTMRAGILVLGPLLAKFKKAQCSMPGGCNLGLRPIDIHLKALSQLGITYKIIKGYVHAHAKKGIFGKEVKFPKISVGATENTIIAACLAKGTTVLKNCAIEPEIKDLTNFLKTAGSKIKWIGKRTVEIEGVKSLKSIKYSVMGDRIETGTFCIAACLSEGNLIIRNFNPKLINTELNMLNKVGAKIKTFKNEIHIKGPKKIRNLNNIITKEYPNFPTDLQAQFMVLLCKANGRSVITENIFENRFMHIGELIRMGANVKQIGSKVIVKKCKKLRGAEVMATDLRASSCLVIAALMADGKTTINRVYHLDRGYENLETKLKLCGAQIKRVKS